MIHSIMIQNQVFCNDSNSFTHNFWFILSSNS